MAIPKNVLAKLIQKDTWVLDFDGLMYPLDSEFATGLYANIANNFNRMASADEAMFDQFKAKLEQEGTEVDDPSQITAENLGKVYFTIIRTINEILDPGSAVVYFAQLYNADYGLIKHDDTLVDAFRYARFKGIRIYFNSNGPSAKEPGHNLHIQNAMKALGFGEEEIDRMRESTFDVVDAANAGVQKNDSTFFTKHFFPFADIRDPSCALVADDGMKYLKAGSEVGLTPIWTWTTDKDPKPADAETAEKIGATRVRNSGEALLEIAKAYQPII